MPGMNFRGASARARSLIAAKKPQDLSRSVLTEDTLRDNIVNEEAAHTERFKTAARQVPHIEYEVEDDEGNKTQKSYDWTGFPDMLRDMAKASFSYDEPELRDVSQVKPSRQLNHAIGAEQLISEGFQSSYPYTRGNPLESLFGAMAMGKDLRKSAQTRLAEHIARSSEMEEQEGIIGDAQDMLNNLKARARQEIKDQGAVQPGTRSEIKGAVKARQAGIEALQALLNQQATSSMVVDAAAAAQSASQAGQDAVDAFNSLPGLSDGGAKNLSPDMQIELAEKWSDNRDLREIAKMLGRMYRDMRFKRETRTNNVPIVPVGVTTGDAIERMLPLEAARAVSDDRFTKFNFASDWMSGQLMTYAMEGDEPAGKGPIICATDGSGSMRGERFIWSSSLGLALMQMAHREKRSFVGIEFGHGSDYKEWRFPKGEDLDVEQVMDYASHFFGGGTDITLALAGALGIVQNEPGFKTADLIIIGDGADHYADDDEQYRKALADLGVRIHGISIMAPNNAYMEQCCETVTDVTDLAGANDATDKLAENIT